MNNHSLIGKGGIMEKVKLTSVNGVSTITLNRPKSYNALDLETIDMLADLLKKVENNEDKVLIFTGEGKAFCAGGDIKMMTDMEKDEFERLMGRLTEISKTLYMMPKIVIVAVNGSAAGLGLSLALAADYIVAHEEARFGMLFAGIGLIPDGGGHFYLKERLGAYQAKKFIWELEQVKGEKAKNMGLVDVLTDKDAKEAAIGLAEKILNAPLKAIIRSKLILHGIKKQELEKVLELEKDGQLEASQTKDHKEGVQAFIEKRKPKFNVK